MFSWFLENVNEERKLYTYRENANSDLILIRLRYYPDGTSKVYFFFSDCPLNNRESNTLTDTCKDAMSKLASYFQDKAELINNQKNSLEII